MSQDQSTFFIVTALVAFVIGLSKGGLGGMLGALITPIMAFILPVDQAIGLILPILMYADLFAVAFHWAHWNTRLVLLLLPGSITGVIVGTLFITNVPTDVLRTGLGIIVLLFAVYKLFEGRIVNSIQYQSRGWHGLLAGTITGFSSTLAHTGGPPVSIYLLMQDLTPQVFVATSALFFLLLNWLKVPFYLYAQLFDFSRLLSIAWIVVPIVPIGVWAGKWAALRFEKKTFENVILVLLVLSSLILIFL
jgi:uncharacterized membrane protein YfcA